MLAKQPHAEPDTGFGSGRTDAGRSGRRNGVNRPDVWATAELALLPKGAHPKQIKLLRPNTILQGTAKAYIKLLLQAAEPHDCMGDHAMMRFRKTSQCAEFISLVGLVVERSSEWQNSSVIAHMGFAGAYDSLHHMLLWSAMMRREVPELLAASYAR